MTDLATLKAERDAAREYWTECEHQLWKEHSRQATRAMSGAFAEYRETLEDCGLGSLSERNAWDFLVRQRRQAVDDIDVRSIGTEL